MGILRAGRRCFRCGGRGGSGGGGCTQFVHSRSRRTIRPRIPTMPGRSTSGGRGGRRYAQFVHSRGRMTINPHIPTMPGRSTSGGGSQFVHFHSRMTKDPRTPVIPGRRTLGFHQPGRRYGVGGGTFSVGGLMFMAWGQHAYGRGVTFRAEGSR